MIITTIIISKNESFFTKELIKNNDIISKNERINLNE